MWQMKNILGLCLLSLLMVGCQGSPHFVKRSQMLMGTVVFVTAVGTDIRIYIGWSFPGGVEEAFEIQI